MTLKKLIQKFADRIDNISYDKKNGYKLFLKPGWVLPDAIEYLGFSELEDLAEALEECYKSPALTELEKLLN